MKWPHLNAVFTLLVLLWFSEAKERKKKLEKVLDEVIASLLLDENLDRHPRSNVTVPTDPATVRSTIYNYWMLPSNIVSTTAATTKRTTESQNYWLDRMLPSVTVASSMEKLKDQIRFQALVKKTNIEFLAFLNKLIEDKKIELTEEDKEIKDEYAELNRTREALFRAYNKQLPDKKLEDLRKKLAEKDLEYRQLMSMQRMRRRTRDLSHDTPWISINYPGGAIREALRMKKSKNEYFESDMESVPAEVSSVVSNDAHFHSDGNRVPLRRFKGMTRRSTPKSTTMSLSEILWKSLGKYLPFSGKNLANYAASIPLEVHYRVGKDVAHITIRVCDLEEPTTTQINH